MQQLPLFVESCEFFFRGGFIRKDFCRFDVVCVDLFGSEGFVVLSYQRFCRFYIALDAGKFGFELSGAFVACATAFLLACVCGSGGVALFLQGRDIACMALCGGFGFCRVFGKFLQVVVVVAEVCCRRGWG